MRAQLFGDRVVDDLGYTQFEPQRYGEQLWQRLFLETIRRFKFRGKIETPDPHLYFQAPGSQCLRLVGIDEDLSFYEGAGEGPNVAKVKEALRGMSP